MSNLPVPLQLYTLSLHDALPISIQLSAERLAMRLTDKLDDKDAAMLQRATQTIVNQVASLKKMVEDFREYARTPPAQMRSEEHTSELQSRGHLVCRLLLEKKKEE